MPAIVRPREGAAFCLFAVNQQLNALREWAMLTIDIEFADAGYLMSNSGRLVSIPSGRRTKWAVLVFGLLAFAMAGSIAGKLNSAQKNDSSAWLPKNAESTKVVDLAKKFTPSETFPAVVVYDRGSGGVTAADEAKARADAKKFAGVKRVLGDQIIQVPPQGNPAVLQTIVPIKVGKNGWNDLGPAVKKIRADAKSDTNGLRVHVTGPSGYAADFNNVFQGFDSTLLFITAAIVIAILLVTYRSPVLWILPLLCVFVALTVAQAVIYLLARHAGLTVNGQSAFILTVLVFGSGTDYALLLIARYREELHRHEDRHEAMAVALHRAGPAIAASGTTVILSLLCLLVAELNSTKSLGPVMAVGVSIGLLAMLSLLPALLVIFGRWLFWPLKPRFDTEEPSERGVWARIGRAMLPRPRIVWVVTAIALGVCSLGILQINAHGLSTQDAYTKDFDSVLGQQVLTDHGLADTASPVMVVANPDHADAVRSAMAGLDGIGDPSPP